MDGTGNGVIHRRLRGSSGGSPRGRMNDFENRIRNQAESGRRTKTMTRRRRTDMRS
jgi:hypothetical protein